MLLDFMLTNREGLVGDVETGDSLGCRDHGIGKFSIRSEGSRAASKITTMDFRRANVSLFRDLLGRIFLDNKPSLSQQCPGGQAGPWHPGVH